MRQRLGLAQALIHEPDLLILDEPTANMDPTGRLSILDKLKQLSVERGVTVFLSSHILSELEQVADSLTMLDRGRVVVSGEMDALKKRFSGNHYLIRASDNKAVFLGIEGRDYVRKAWLNGDDDFVHAISEDGPRLRKRILDIVVEKGLDLQHLSEEQVDLQSIYRKTMGMKEENR
jgi:ABC-2 type transport system ATP-binding protein